MNHFERSPQWLRLLVYIGIISVIGLLDNATGDEIAFSIFYLIPVALAAWIDGECIGICISILCGGSCFVADISTIDKYSHAWMPYWNMGMLIVFFAIVTIMLSSLKDSHERERELSRVDRLSGLWNGRYFYELAGMEIERSRRNARPMTIAYFDVDNFKAVNDSRGHAEGDALLARIGISLKDGIRETDIPSRLGGDEFAVLFPEAGFEAASKLLPRLKDSLEMGAKDMDCSVTFSIGAATFESPPHSVEQMVKISDELMYRVKRGGKGAICHETAPSSPSVFA